MGIPLVAAAGYALLASLVASAAGILAAVAGARRLAAGLYASSSLLAVAAGVLGVLAYPEPVRVYLPELRLWPGFTWRPIIAYAGLGGCFLAAVGLACLVASFYTLYYWGLRHGEPPRTYMACMGLSMASMYLLCTCFDFVTLLVAWEAASLALAVCVGYGEEGERAGLLYLLVTHAASLPMFASIAWLLSVGVQNYASFYEYMASIPHWFRLLLVSCFLVAFTAKSGLLPFYFWLPPAHSRAPTDSSVLLSGASVKPPIYQALLVLSLSGYPWEVTPVLVGLASASMVLGVLGALWSREGKRLLAYSTVEWMAAAWLLVGLFVAVRAPVLLYAVAGVVLAHAAFKAVGFAAMGIAKEYWGTDELSRVGGLCRVGVRECLAAVASSFSLLLIPPLPLFAGELALLYSLVLVTAEHPPAALALVVAVTCASLGIVAYARLVAAITSCSEPPTTLRGMPLYTLAAMAFTIIVAPVLVALCLQHAGLPVYWLALYVIPALALAVKLKPRRLTSVWVSGETLARLATGLQPVSPASPKPSIEEVFGRARMPELEEVGYSGAYYALAGLLARLSRLVVRLHSGRLHLYILVMVVFFLVMVLVGVGVAGW